MKKGELPISAKKLLERWCNNRKHVKSKKGTTCSLEPSSRSKVIQLLVNRDETLSELEKEYRVSGSVDVRCNTSKLEKKSLSEVQQVGRTAGHFGIFSPCGIGRAVDIFWLDESLSQTWGFVIDLAQKFPKQFTPCSFLGYDNACNLARFFRNQAERYPESAMAEALSKLKKVHDRLHLRNHHTIH